MARHCWEPGVSSIEGRTFLVRAVQRQNEIFCEVVSSGPLGLLEKGLDSYLVILTRPFSDLIACEFTEDWSAKGPVLGGLVCSGLACHKDDEEARSGISGRGKA